MKYMGSKRWMLRNGLGELLLREGRKATRFVDLFSGSAAVSHFVAENIPVPVLACDLQEYSSVLAAAIIGREHSIAGGELWREWISRAKKLLSLTPPIGEKITKSFVTECRLWSNSVSEKYPITAAYGGHYFSPSQAIWIDCLRRTLPTEKSERSVALAALISASSKCAAAPGHTAQPFQPTRSAKKFISESWNRDFIRYVEVSLLQLSERRALKKGSVAQADANALAKTLREGDLVFVDPPYSGVQYSRFYHVLESVCKGMVDHVSGTGRYPPSDDRPRSKYSMVSASTIAIESLLETISEKGAKVILTFPTHQCSNGLSGGEIAKIAAKNFSVELSKVKSRLSTLGGPSAGGEGRAARLNANELILLLSPRGSRRKG